MLSIAASGASRIGHVHAKTIAAHPRPGARPGLRPFEDAAEKPRRHLRGASCKDAEEVFADPDRRRHRRLPTPLPHPHLLAAAKAARRCCARSRSPWT